MKSKQAKLEKRGSEQRTGRAQGYGQGAGLGDRARVQGWGAGPGQGQKGATPPGPPAPSGHSEYRNSAPCSPRCPGALPAPPGERGRGDYPFPGQVPRLGHHHHLGVQVLQNGLVLLGDAGGGVHQEPIVGPLGYAGQEVLDDVTMTCTHGTTHVMTHDMKA